MEKIIVLLVSFVIGGLGSWAAMTYGGRIGINDFPGNRSSHSKVIPKGGGVGLLIAFVWCSFYFSIPAYLWIPGLIISLVSLWGDRKEIAPLKRLMIQFLCAFIFLGGAFFQGGAEGISFLLFLPLAFFITGTSNVYNFMDGIDGIAGMTGVIAFFMIWLFNDQNGEHYFYEVLCLTMVSACAGFLIFNMPRARVFMGDGGSILLGFVFSCLIVCLADSPQDFLIMVGFLAPFYFDEIYTMAVRIKCGESLFTPHRKHLYQILVNELGIDHWKVSMFYVLLQLLFGLILIFLNARWGQTAILGSYMLFALMFLCLSFHVRRKVGQQ